MALEMRKFPRLARIAGHLGNPGLLWIQANYRRSSMKRALVMILLVALASLAYAQTGGAILGSGSVVISGAHPGDPGESIYVRKVGHGPQTIVFVPGNNTSGAIFDGIFQYFRGIEELNNAYTVYTFDYRGSGFSSYNKEITGLKDFALDFEKVMDKIEGFPKSGVALVGYSMGFGVALEMSIANPARYSSLISLAGIGTRGVRVSIANASQAGTDSLGQKWAAGDWITVSDDKKGIAGTAFQQASWQGEARNIAGVQFVWDLLVFEDALKYDIASYKVGDLGPKAQPGYMEALLDVLTVQYMPESLYYCQKFNVSTFDLSHTNADGSLVTIPGDNRLGRLLAGKKVLLVKASTDFQNWRGDQVIYDNYTATTKFDLKKAGADVTAVLIDPNQGFDHGFPVLHPLETVHLIDSFLRGVLNAETAGSAIGGTVKYYDNAETSWETSKFTGF
jgi:pimeloyl-ACP methyl ester carboxylesterase